MGAISVIRYLMGHPLTTRRAGVLWKFLRWQIGAGLLRQKVVFDWIDEARLIGQKGEAAVTGNYYVGLQEYEDMAFLLHFLTDQTFVDVGANAGTYSVLGAKVKGCNCVAFEPVAATFQRLLDQVHINRVAGRVQVLNKAAGKTCRQAQVTSRFDSTNRVLSDQAADDASCERIDVVTLDSVLDPAQRFVLKIDVEGFEMEVLSGARSLLERHRVDAVVIELNGSGEAYGVSDSEIHQLLFSHGLHPVSYEPGSRLLTPLPGPNPDRGNTIYVADIQSTRETVREGGEYRVHSAFGACV